MRSLSFFHTLAACLIAVALTDAPALADAPAKPELTSSSKANTLMDTARPILFRELMPFDTEQHRNIQLPAERKSFAFAAQAPVLPLTFAEVGLALRHYPIVMVAERDSVALVAMTGLGSDKAGGNLFVDAHGEWLPGTYIPAYVRGYPFIAIRPAPGAEPVLAMDPQAADFRQPGGSKLLGANGQPSEQLKGIMAFHTEYRQLAERTAQMTQALKDAGVLEEGRLQLQPAGAPANSGDAATQTIGGFLVVTEPKLKALSADALKKLLEADALGLAYAQVLSMASLGNLLAAPAAQPVPASVALDKPAKAPETDKPARTKRVKK